MVPSQADPRGDPDYDHVAAQIVARLIELPRRAVVLAEDEHPAWNCCTAPATSNGPLATSTVKVIHTAPCDRTDGRYDHTTWLGKLI